MIQYQTDENLKEIEKTVNRFLTEKGNGKEVEIDDRSLVILGAKKETINDQVAFSFVTLNVPLLKIDIDICGNVDESYKSKVFMDVEELKQYLDNISYEELIGI
ncbi:hypothetical protein [Mammaliicoccus sciuri]|uniref:Uncharacterized protein n=1 Tax=Mammaliicoccus sciuri TaxID=1296 RepID=A0AAW5LTG5_MAMSC|nr:hypothetical protein [Mammaliicoccus sciuri]MBG9206919.1 hypothetical protein [Mammaliicoccus sciuri]MCJ0941404.1 hypothetical protein [Mammaliicoccus sciuri]MCQ9304943.1 hypothetical protein [Mammaliicoccus sciuri]